MVYDGSQFSLRHMSAALNLDSLVSDLLKHWELLLDSLNSHGSVM